MSARDRAGVQHHDKLFGLSGAPGAPNGGREFGQVIAEAAGLDGEAALAARDGDAFFGEDGFGFDDFLDLINPLQHIPIVSTIYRELNGDEISPGARIFGGAIFGGPLGFAAALGNAALEQVAGKDIGELELSLFESDAPDSKILTAESTPLPVANDSEADILNPISPTAAETPSPVALLASSEEPEALSSIPNAFGFLKLMDEEQKALLLSSLGISSEPVVQSGARETVSNATDHTAKFAAPASHEAASPELLPTTASHMEWPQSTVPPGVNPGSPDWIAQTISRALDKYENSFGASPDRGDRLDSKI